MIVRASAIALLLALAAGPATLAPRTAAAEPLAAATTPVDDVRRTILVGPSGQLWQPDGQGGWTRSAGGGVGTDVQGIAVADDLIIAGSGTPLFRRHDDAWYGLRLGERGKTHLGTGPAPAVSIGKEVFVWARGAWTRVATADRPVVALWAESDRKLFVATDRAVLRLAGKKLVPALPLAAVRFAGRAPLALTADGVVHDLATRAALAPTADGQPVTADAATQAPDGTPWILGRAGADRALVRRTRTGWERRPAPPLAADDTVVHLAVDGSGRVLVATAAGAIHLADAAGAWTRGTLTTRLPDAKPGPGPARMP
ncbi:MAG TPA: hypothetical protein VHE35_18905 [Kofleriaceae bacterium]|nr:hypothetical protein [Kofleriaceae bacterium]